jgi:hypothetical protein
MDNMSTIVILTSFKISRFLSFYCTLSSVALTVRRYLLRSSIFFCIVVSFFRLSPSSSSKHVNRGRYRYLASGVCTVYCKVAKETLFPSTQRICRGHRSQSRPWCHCICNQLMDSAAFMCFLVGTNPSASCLGVVKFV